MVLVLPTRRAPACNRVVTAGAVAIAGGCVLAQSGLPYVVMAPATSNRSFTANVRPERRPDPIGGRIRRGPGTKAPYVSSTGTICFSLPADCVISLPVSCVAGCVLLGCPASE